MTEIPEDALRAFVLRGCKDAYIARCFETTEAHIKELRRALRIGARVRPAPLPNPSYIPRIDPEAAFAHVKFQDDPAASAEARQPAIDYPVMKAMR